MNTRSREVMSALSLTHNSLAAGLCTKLFAFTSAPQHRKQLCPARHSLSVFYTRDMLETGSNIYVMEAKRHKTLMSILKEERVQYTGQKKKEKKKGHCLSVASLIAIVTAGLIQLKEAQSSLYSTMDPQIRLFLNRTLTPSTPHSVCAM